MYAQYRKIRKSNNLKVFRSDKCKDHTQDSQNQLCGGFSCLWWCIWLYIVFVVAYVLPITVSDYVFKNLTFNGMEIAALSLTLTGLLLVLWPERCPAGLYKPFKCCIKNEIEAQQREQRSHSHSVLHFNKTWLWQGFCVR